MKSYTFLLYTLLITNVTLRFFTNYLNVIPRHFNITDVGIAGLFFVLFINHRLQSSKAIRFKKILILLLAFNIILVFGALANAEYFYYKAAIGQMIMFNEPIILFIALVNLPFTLRDIKTFNKLLISLIILEFVIGVFQVPLCLISGESEAIMGTFQHNAEQYAAFVLIGVLFLLGRATLLHRNKLLCYVIILTMFSLILFIDNKASWVGIGVSLFYVMNKLGKLSYGPIHKIRNISFICLLACLGIYVVSNTSGTTGKFGSIRQAWDSGNILNLGKIKAYGDVYTAYRENPYMAILGSGPGTFYSRSCYQFYGIPKDAYDLSPLITTNYGAEEYRESSSMGGVIQRVDRDPFYKKFTINRKFYFIGSGQVDSPFSSYNALLGETGIPGIFIYISIYIIILKRLGIIISKYKKDPNIFPLVITAIGFLIYSLTVSIYGPWIETGRMTTILFSMIAMVCKYDELVENKKYVENKVQQPLRVAN